MTGGWQLLVLAKAPEAGQVKTRLCPPCSPAQAAALAAAALADTLAAALATPAAGHVLVLAGEVAGLPPGLRVQQQRGEGLDSRLDAAFADAHAAVPLPMLLVGMDTPQLTPAMLAGAAGQLLIPGTDAVLGPAADGGWWALGLRGPGDGLLAGVPMSTPGTLAATRERLRAAGLRVRELPQLADVDTIADARQVAAAAPRTRFAARLAVLEAGAA